MASAFIKRPIRRFLERCGYIISSRSRFGIDPFDDIRKLAKSWNVPLNNFFDVGANTGDTALRALEEFPAAAVFSFEPHPKTFCALRERTNGHNRMSSFNFALSENCGQAILFEYDQSVINSLIPSAPYAVHFDKKAREVPVACVTLDLFCEEQKIDRIAILKIDTEGYDLIVLKGARALLLERKIDFIYCEFNNLRPQDKTNGGSLVDFDIYLAPFGYRFVASYNDYVDTSRGLFLVSNALFALHLVKDAVEQPRRAIRNRP